MPWETKKIDTGHHSDTAMVPGIPFSIKNRQFDPAVIRVEPDAPDNGGDPGGDIVEFKDFRIRLPERLVTWLDWRGDAVGIDIFVDGVLDAVRDCVGLIEILFQVGGKMQNWTANFLQPAVQTHSFCCELAEIDVSSAVAAGDIVVRLGPNPLLLRMLVDRLIAVAHVVQPLDHILAPIAAGAVRRLAHAQMGSPASSRCRSSAI